MVCGRLARRGGRSVDSLEVLVGVEITESLREGREGRGGRGGREGREGVKVPYSL